METDPDSRREERRSVLPFHISDQLAIVIVVAMFVLDLLLFPALYPITGGSRDLIMFLTWPVLAAAWLLGMRAGALAMLVAIIIATFQLNSVGYPGWDALFRVGGAHGTLVTVIFALAVGRLRDLHKRLGTQTQALAESEERYRYLALHDALTGLPNRTLFFDRLEQAVAHARRYEQRPALLFIDLDGFKAINDEWGHEAGDALLQQVARRLTRAVRQSDTVARMGGDEFTVILSSVPNAEHARALAEKLRAALVEPYVVNQRTILLSASVGLSYYTNPSLTEDEFIKQADTAMYQRKAARKSQSLYAIEP